MNETIRCMLALIPVIFACSLSPKITLAEVFKFKLGDTGVRISAISKTGVVYPGTLQGTTEKVTIPANKLSGASFFATEDGRLLGPVLATVGDNGVMFLGKKIVNASGKKLKTLTFTLNPLVSGANYVLIKTPKGSVFNKKAKYTLSAIPTLGLNVEGSTQAAQNLTQAQSFGDSDGDGVINSLDVDADGDGIQNIADSNTELAASKRPQTREAEALDVPFTALYLALNQSLNWHIDGALTSSAIDSVIGGENKFSIAFFFGLPSSDTSGISGGHVICGPLAYCRPTEGDTTGTGIYSGFTEGNQSLAGQFWSDIQTNGHEYSLESFSVGGSSDTVYAASIQPRVGTSDFRPGDNYLVEFTNDSNAVVSRKTLTLPPYFLTTPAIRTYNTTSSDASLDTAVDYSDTSSVGMNVGNPIVLASSGDYAGKLGLSVWRLQRLAVAPDESGDYRDFGHLNYGLLINNNSGEFSCGELYSDLSSTLSELPSVGTGGSYSSSLGANLWPLVDSADDYEPSSSSDPTIVGNNTIRFTTNLTQCRVRNGLSAGVHQVNLIAAGVDTGHGSNRAGQLFFVNIP